MLIHLLRLTTRETGAKALAVASAAISTANLNIFMSYLMLVEGAVRKSIDVAGLLVKESTSILA